MKGKALKDQQANCTHSWALGSPQGGLIHGVCKKCGLERDLPDQVRVTRREAAEMAEESLPDPLPPSQPPPRPKEVRAAHLYYEQHKAEILADLAALGPGGMLERWSMTAGTWTGLRRRWGIAPGKGQRGAVEPGPTAAPAQGAGSNAIPPALRLLFDMLPAPGKQWRQRDAWLSAFTALVKLLYQGTEDAKGS